jgi:hypothetical protein
MGRRALVALPGSPTGFSDIGTFHSLSACVCMCICAMCVRVCVCACVRFIQFADSAKRVMTRARVNNSMVPDRVLVKRLQAEIERLKKLIMSQGERDGSSGTTGSNGGGSMAAQVGAAFLCPNSPHPLPPLSPFSSSLALYLPLHFSGRAVVDFTHIPRGRLNDVWWRVSVCTSFGGGGGVCMLTARSCLWRRRSRERKQPTTSCC